MDRDPEKSLAVSKAFSHTARTGTVLSSGHRVRNFRATCCKKLQFLLANFVRSILWKVEEGREAVLLKLQLSVDNLGMWKTFDEGDRDSSGPRHAQCTPTPYKQREI